MAKKKQDTKIELIILNWEFLRRNPQYTKDYELLRECVGEMDDGERELIKKGAFKSIKPFCDKWAITFPVDPKFDPSALPASKRCLDRKKSPLWRLEPKRENKSVRVIPTYGHFDAILSDREIPPENAVLVVDLRYSKRVIGEALKSNIDLLKRYYGYHCEQEQFESFCLGKISDGIPFSEREKELVDKYKLYSSLFGDSYAMQQIKTPADRQYLEKLLSEFYEYRKREKKRQQPLSKRYREFELYKKYLQVWDLKEAEPNITWREIQERLELNNTQNARDYYRQAKKLIMEGFTM